MFCNPEDESMPPPIRGRLHREAMTEGVASPFPMGRWRGEAVTDEVLRFTHSLLTMQGKKRRPTAYAVGRQNLRKVDFIEF